MFNTPAMSSEGYYWVKPVTNIFSVALSCHYSLSELIRKTAASRWQIKIAQRLPFFSFTQGEHTHTHTHFLVETL